MRCYQGQQQGSSLAAEWFGTRLQIAVGVATRNSGGRNAPKNLRAKRTGSWILEQRLDLDLALGDFRCFTAAQVFRSELGRTDARRYAMAFVDVSPDTKAGCRWRLHRARLGGA